MPKKNAVESAPGRRVRPDQISAKHDIEPIREQGKNFTPCPLRLRGNSFKEEYNDFRPHGTLSGLTPNEMIQQHSNG